MANLTLDIELDLPPFTVAADLSVGAETLALVGPSGAGKTTVLRAIAGLAEPDRGSIRLDEEAWFEAERGLSLPPERRSVGFVFQDYALFPHLSVAKNVGFGAAAEGAEVEALLERFRIAHLARARPGTLSGGERQRVALARALARRPEVLLLDEPLSALDTHTRDAVRGELRELLDGLGLPAVFITHDFRDAAALAQRAAVIVAGQVRQVGPVASLAESPSDAFVAALTGNNVLPGTASPAGEGTRVLLDGGAELRLGPGPSGRVGAVIAPWEVRLAPGPGPAPERNALRGRVLSATRLGDRVEARVGPVNLECTVEEAGRAGLEPGAELWLELPAAAVTSVPWEDAESAPLS